MPKMLETLLGLTPATVENIVTIDTYLSFTMQVLVFFGIGFLVPLLFLMLNLAGILSARRFFGWWRGLILGSFLFGAVATPTGDPFWMTMAALRCSGCSCSPAGSCWSWTPGAPDGPRRGTEQWADDEVSALDEQDLLDARTPVAPVAPVAPVEPSYDGPLGDDIT